MRVLVVTGGLAPPARVVRNRVLWADLVVAADSGMDTLVDAGLRPDVAVGDFDSTRATDELADMRPGNVLRYPADKSETDTEIAIRLAHERGAAEICLVGGGGGEMSHFLAIVSLFDRQPAPSVWLSHDTEYTLITSSMVAEGQPGDRVSFFPAGEEGCTMTSSGLRWPLDGLEWHRGDFGVSNEFVGESIEVTMQTGRLVMVRMLEG